MKTKIEEERKMIKILCPVCGSIEGYVREDTKLVWGTCGKCGAKFTSEGGLNVKEGWVKVGCWEPPKEKLNEEVIDYIKSKGARPLISGEWLSKQEKLGKTFLHLKPQVDALIEDYFKTATLEIVPEEELSEEKEAWRTEEYEKTVNELKERFGMLNPM